MAKHDDIVAAPSDGLGVVTLAPRKVVFSAMRNEAPFILEWVAYHLEIGFDHIIVLSNDSDDGTHELLTALHDCGVIEHHVHTVPKGVSPQANAGRVANEKHLIAHGDWVVWLDADEFLNVHLGDGTLDDLIAFVDDKKGMAVQWRFFGDGGNRTFPGRFISDDFCGASDLTDECNQEIKMLFRHGPDVQGFAAKGIHRPLLAEDTDLSCADFLNSNGETLRPSRVTEKWLGGADLGKTCFVSAADIGAPVAQVNHYCVRTSEYYALKRVRGNGWLPMGSRNAHRRHSDDFYKAHNLNDQKDRTILKHENAVTRRIERLLRDDRISRAANVVLRRTNIALLRSAGHEVTAEDARETMELPLPAEVAAYLKERIEKVDSVLAYGSGAACRFALESGVDNLMIIEGDPIRADRVSRSRQDAFPNASLDVHYVDIGEVTVGSKPKDNRGYQNYHAYALSCWDLPHFVQPDLILIDGSFGAECFWAAVMKITQPTTVLFCDYMDHVDDHGIAAKIPPAETIGSMARFEIGPGIDAQSQLSQIFGKFCDAR